jgi:hypothetical protein
MSSIKLCPKPFNFKYPKPKGKIRGTVQKEEVVECVSDEQKDYHKVAQLLEWADGGFSIRLGYYLKPVEQKKPIGCGVLKQHSYPI